MIAQEPLDRRSDLKSGLLCRCPGHCPNALGEFGAAVVEILAEEIKDLLYYEKEGDEQRVLLAKLLESKLAED